MKKIILTFFILMTSVYSNANEQILKSPQKKINLDEVVSKARLKSALLGAGAGHMYVKDSMNAEVLTYMIIDGVSYFAVITGVLSGCSKNSSSCEDTKDILKVAGLSSLLLSRIWQYYSVKSYTKEVFNNNELSAKIRPKIGIQKSLNGDIYPTLGFNYQF